MAKKTRIILDVRSLDPPEPAVKIVETLKNLKEGDEIEVIGDRPFKNILPRLKEAGYRYDLRQAGDAYILKIWGEGEIKQISEPEQVSCRDENVEISETMTVGSLLDEYPKAVDILVEYGFTPLKDPEMRKGIVGGIRLEEAKEFIGLDDQKFGEMMERLRALESS